MSGQDALTLALTNWPPNEPVNYLGQAGQWNDVADTNTLYYVVEYPVSTETDITAFSFPQQVGAVTIDANNHTINLEVANGTSLTNLVATFTLSTGATASIGGTNQVSGTTANDFSNPVVYTLTAQDGTTTQNWTVTVTVASAASIHAFTYNNTNYEIIKTGVTWQQANANAIARGGFLARIDDQAENNAIYNEADFNANIDIDNESLDNGDGGSICYLWLGGNDMTTEGTWNWTNNNDQFWSGNENGSSTNSLFHNWGREFGNNGQYEPDNSGGSPEQDALALAIDDWAGYAGQWNDIDENNTLYYVVEYPSCMTTTNTVTTTVCDSYTGLSGKVWTISGTYMDTISNANNCDSVTTYNLTINTSNTGTDVQTACDTYTWIDGNTYTTSNNTATHTLVGGNANGCDSVVTLDLTINTSTTGTDVQTACNTYTWIDGNTYTASNNTATHTIPNGNTNGCDSLVTLNLTISANTSTDVQTACDSLAWIDGVTYYTNNNTATFTIIGGAVNGCDSMVTLNLTINSNTGTDTQTACNSYAWIDGNTYTANNTTATHTLTNAAGCDSVVTLNLTLTTIDNTVTLSAGGDSLTANQSGAIYQWLDCDNANAIMVGATNKVFVATNPGNYTVELVLNGCVDTSACEFAVKVDEVTSTSTFNIYPNPVKETLMISATETISSISIFGVNGQLVQTIAHPKNARLPAGTEVNVSNLVKGMYIIKVQTNKGTAQMKFIKE